MHSEFPSSTTNIAGSSISVPSNSTPHLQLQRNLVDEAQSSQRSNPSKEKAISLDLPDRSQGETSKLYYEIVKGRDNAVVGSSPENGSSSSSDVDSTSTLSPNAEGETHETNPNSESSSPSSGGTESEIEELIKSAALVPRMARPHYVCPTTINE
ncbi:hypothetical protein BDQ12DRAFT_724277 [Crucibulum laeve]|uniref:Uncharacterized protein n=1 Tax=Crucibulum laeve TaxID=68775 RepID=A0A5C3LXL0_9AGAR|nr:hypothetical protein BDQ12DRAFT_724277 [Crucibulum laeve]